MSADKRRQEWATPRAVFQQLHAEYRFTVDAAASAHNAKLPRYWTEYQDGLEQRWEGERVWCNPPYCEIDPWVERAITARDANAGGMVAMLLPARTDSRWFMRAVVAGVHLHWFRGRVSFIPAAGIRASSNAAASVLLVFDYLDHGDCVRDARTGAVLHWSPR